MAKNTHTWKEVAKLHFRLTLGRVKRFFTGWLLLGIIMMLMNATIWPTASTDIRWFYQVTTLWLNVINKICELAFPYLQIMGNWLVNIANWLFTTIAKFCEWICANWSAVLMVFSKLIGFAIGIFVFFAKLCIYALFLLLFLIVLTATILLVQYSIDQEMAKRNWEYLKEEFLKEFHTLYKNSFGNKDRNDHQAELHEDDNTTEM